MPTPSAPSSNRGPRRGGSNDRRGPGGDRGRGRGGDRGGRGGGRREPSEFSEATLSVDRVTRVVKGGRRMRFRAIVVVGNKKGKVGLGTGKATEVMIAVKKASSAAKRAMIKIPLKKGTIPHEVELKFKAARIRLMPALPGTGIIAGGALRVILDQAGVKDVLSKRFGSRNKLVNAQTTMKALKLLRPLRPGDLQAEEKVAAVEAGEPAIPVKEISRKEAEAQNQAANRAKIEE